MIRFLRFALLPLLFIGSCSAQISSGTDVSAQDPLQRHVSGVQLDDETVLDGIIAVTRAAGLPLSIEYPLRAKMSDSAPSVKTVTAAIEPDTVQRILDRLCGLDPEFTWMRNGTVVNVLPRSLADDPLYLLNRRVDEITFNRVSHADDAVVKMVGQLPGPREQLAVLQVGVVSDFARPWNATLKQLTVREVLNAIALQFGSGWGWELSGAKNFRMITFHQSLSVGPKRLRQDEP